MRFIQLVPVIIISLSTCIAAADPTVLIVQTKAPPKQNVDINVSLSDYLSQELDNDGRLVPLIYSATDPAFLAAVKKARLRETPDAPTARQALGVAQRLGAEYVLFVEATQAVKVIKSKLTLIKDRRQVWKDEQNMSVSAQDIVNQDSTCRSLARTLVFRMNGGPLRGYVPRKKTETPEPAKGQEPIVTPAPVQTTAVVSDDDLKKQVNDLAANGKRAAAIVAMRDGVDIAPFDLDRREELVNLLLLDDPKSAAEEARRAAVLMPDKSELRALAARAWMQAGKPDEAQKDLNEAIARDPNGTSTRLLLGELSLDQLEPAKAIDHLDQAVKQHDSSRARFLRAVCRSMLGGIDSMQADLLEAGKLEPQLTTGEVSERYFFVGDITDRLLAKDGIEVRNLTQEVVIKPHNRDLKEEMATMSRGLQARIVLLDTVVSSPDLRQVSARRLLANKLMAQCLVDLQTFCEKGDEDALADSRINLGEALKQLAAVRKK